MLKMGTGNPSDLELCVHTNIVLWTSIFKLYECERDCLLLLLNPNIRDAMELMPQWLQ